MQEVHLKIQLGSELRRVSVTTECFDDYRRFCVQLRELFQRPLPGLEDAHGQHRFQYLDSDGDRVSVCTVEEWAEAGRWFNASKVDPLRIFIDQNPCHTPEALQPLAQPRWSPSTPPPQMTQPPQPAPEPIAVIEQPPPPIDEPPTPPSEPAPVAPAALPAPSPVPEPEPMPAPSPEAEAQPEPERAPQPPTPEPAAAQPPTEEPRATSPLAEPPTTPTILPEPEPLPATQPQPEADPVAAAVAEGVRPNEPSPGATEPLSATPEAPAEEPIPATTPPAAAATPPPAGAAGEAGAGEGSREEEVNKLRDQAVTTLNDSGLQLVASREPEQLAKAVELFREATRLYHSRPFLWYNYACAQALTGDTDGAMDSLRRAEEVGFTSYRHARTDLDLEPLKDLPEFKNFIKEVKAKVVAARVAAGASKIADSMVADPPANGTGNAEPAPPVPEPTPTDPPLPTPALPGTVTDEGDLPAQYKDALETMVGMGLDRQSSKILILKHNGDLSNAIEEHFRNG